MGDSENGYDSNGWTRVADRRLCRLCKHSRGCHDGKLPNKCALTDCTCPTYYEPERANAESHGEPNG